MQYADDAVPDSSFAASRAGGARRFAHRLTRALLDPPCRHLLQVGAAR